MRLTLPNFEVGLRSNRQVESGNRDAEMGYISDVTAVVKVQKTDDNQ